VLGQWTISTWTVGQQQVLQKILSATTFLTSFWPSGSTFGTPNFVLQEQGKKTKTLHGRDITDAPAMQRYEINPAKNHTISALLDATFPAIKSTGNVAIQYRAAGPAAGPAARSAPARARTGGWKGKGWKSATMMIGMNTFD
jgi:hypothetical protein